MFNGERENRTEQPEVVNRLKLNERFDLVFESYNFGLEADSDYNKMNLMLSDIEKGVRMDLSNFLNEINPSRKNSYRFAYNFLNHFGGNVRKGIISLPKEGLTDPKDLMAILHEVGHIVAFEEDQEKSPQKALKTPGALYGADKESARLTYEVEQDAWKKGIAQAELLNKLFGFNIFSFFSSAQELRDYIFKYLGNHKKLKIDRGHTADYKTLKEQRLEDFIKQAYERNQETERE